MWIASGDGRSVAGAVERAVESSVEVSQEARSPAASMAHARRSPRSLNSFSTVSREAESADMRSLARRQACNTVV
jgi:hypothetical protein